MDVRFYFDPVCPFAWTTSKWVRRVAELRGYDVEWRFISLRIVNEAADEPKASHVVGLSLLRVAARAREELGADAVARLYRALGEESFESAGPARDVDGGRALAVAALKAAELPEALLSAYDDESLDATIRAETEEALALVGKDLGTPIVHVDAPSGPAFFGPVISRLPSDEDAMQLWDHVSALAAFPGFAEIKRSLREPLELPGLKAG